MTYTAEIDRMYEPVGTRYQTVQSLETWNVELESTRNRRVPAGYYRPGAKRVSIRGAATYLGITDRVLRDRMRRGNGPAITFHDDKFAVTVEALFAYAAERGEGPK